MSTLFLMVVWVFLLFYAIYLIFSTICEMRADKRALKRTLLEKSENKQQAEKILSEFIQNKYPQGIPQKDYKVYYNDAAEGLRVLFLDNFTEKLCFWIENSEYTEEMASLTIEFIKDREIGREYFKISESQELY